MPRKLERIYPQVFEDQKGEIRKMAYELRKSESEIYREALDIVLLDPDLTRLLKRRMGGI